MIKIQHSSSASIAKLRGKDLPHNFFLEQTKQKETSQLPHLSLLPFIYILCKSIAILDPSTGLGCNSVTTILIAIQL